MNQGGGMKLLVIMAFFMHLQTKQKTGFNWEYPDGAVKTTIKLLLLLLFCVF